MQCTEDENHHVDFHFRVSRTRCLHRDSSELPWAAEACGCSNQWWKWLWWHGFKRLLPPALNDSRYFSINQQLWTSHHIMKGKGDEQPFSEVKIHEEKSKDRWDEGRQRHDDIRGRQMKSQTRQSKYMPAIYNHCGIPIFISVPLSPLFHGLSREVSLSHEKHHKRTLGSGRERNLKSNFWSWGQIGQVTQSYWLISLINAPQWYQVSPYPNTRQWQKRIHLTISRGNTPWLGIQWGP